MVLFVLSRIFLALSPMVLEEEERYMFGEHIPKMYLTYTPLCTLSTRIFQYQFSGKEVYDRYMSGTCCYNVYLPPMPITIDIWCIMRYILVSSTKKR